MAMVQKFRMGPSMKNVLVAWACALMALASVGCGASKAMAPPMDARAEYAPEAPEAPAEPMPGTAADEDSLYRGGISEERESAVMTGGVAQAAAPAPQKEADKKASEVQNDATKPPPAKDQSGVDTGTSGQKVAGPMLIYRATLTMAVFETRKAIDAVEKLAKDSGGYLVSREDQLITVRVPTGKFDGTLDKIGKLGDLLHRNVNVQDVTSEYTDTAIRLRNLEVMRDRLEELLKKANKVDDALAVERELQRVTSEIERLKGRLKLLRELISFSTITVEFQPRPTDHVDNKVRLPFPWLDQLGLGELLRL
jgi:hypothetical protein